MSAPLAPTLDASSSILASDSTSAHPRPLKAPPLKSLISTPGFEVPGGYPRDSTVFAGNKWDNRDAQPGMLAAAKTYLPGIQAPSANAKAHLPPAVASYFPAASTSSDSVSSSYRIAHANSNPNVHTPYPINTDGSITSTFSTHAYAGSDRGTITPIPSSPTPSTPRERTPSPPAEERRRTQLIDPGVVPLPGAAPAGPAEDRRRLQLIDPGVTPVPISPVLSSNRPSLNSPTAHVAPPSAASTSSGSALASDASTPSTSSTLSTAPSSPASASSHKRPPSRFVRWVSGTKRSSLPAVAKTSSPPSAFAKSSPARASLDSPSSPPSAIAKSTPTHASGYSSSSPPSAFTKPARTSAENASPSSSGPPATYKFTPMEPGDAAPTPPAKRRTSLLRALRGEVKVLTGKVRRDPSRVEAGRKMMSEV
ncbi:hypothetical protein B0H17DRAFT_1136895 [Mycena rosella]|uniref:Uncharacterized protein n=1 Tax=Mycena rosella TaxID=1033263 RepID=A0AAD7DA29_MYCRO|nr:hypothetical protein B0H17DRAFT_1136895 [Mycena rosella]